MSDRPDSGAAVEQEPQSGAPPIGASETSESADDEFWRLAKKGLVSWGREPSIEEIVDYWRGLIDDQRREDEALASRSADDRTAPLSALTSPGGTDAATASAPATAAGPSLPPAGGVDDPVAVLEALASLGRMGSGPGASRASVGPADAGGPDVGEPGTSEGSSERVARAEGGVDDPVGVVVAAVGPGPPGVGVVVGSGPAEVADDAVTVLGGLVRLGRADGGGVAGGRSGVMTVEAGEEAPAETSAEVAGAGAMVTAAAVGWLAVPVAGMPPPLVGATSRRWWRVAAARPLPPSGTGVRPERGEQLPGPLMGRSEEVAGPVVGHGEEVAGPVVGVAGEMGVGGGERGAAAGAEVRPLGLAGGGLAFADCLAWLDRCRRAQQARRRWGRHIALPAAPLDAYERELRQGADAASAEHLETALRAAAAGAGIGGLPPVDWVEAAADGVVLALAAPEDPPPGFVDVTGGRGTWATGPGDDSGRDVLGAAAARALPVLPLLAPLGRTGSGRERLVDLEARAVATIDGPADDVLGLLRATVVAMATAAWCTPLRIVVVGLERELAGLPGVEVVDSLDVALTYAEAHVHQVISALASLGETSLGRVRALGLSSAAAGALLVVSARPPDDPEVGRRVAALAGRRSSGVGVLLLHPPNHGVDLAGACSHLRIEPDGTLHDDEGHDRDERVWARRLDAADARRLVALLAVAGRRDDGEAALRPRRSPGDAGRSRDGREDAAVDVLAGTDVLVRVLGDVEVLRLHADRGDEGFDGLGRASVIAGGEGRDGARATAEAGAVEVVAYLALQEASVTHATLEAALFPDGAPDAHAADRSVTAAVELVGPGLVRRPTPGRCAVSERVATDYGLLCDLVARADDAVAAGDLPAAADRLSAALGLVRSAPLGGLGHRFAWAGPAREAIVAQVVDAADSLASLRARAGDWVAVDRAAVQGLRVAPASERLHRWRMRAAHAAGDLDRVHELFEAACDLVAEPTVGVEPEDTLQPETVQLLEALVANRPAGEPITPAVPTEPRAPGEVRRLAPDRPLPITEELPEVAATRPPDALIA